MRSPNNLTPFIGATGTKFLAAMWDTRPPPRGVIGVHVPVWHMDDDGNPVGEYRLIPLAGVEKCLAVVKDADGATTPAA